MEERGCLVAALPRYAVSQDAILHVVDWSAAWETGQRAADWQSAKRQIENLRYAKHFV
jgi:hypothetical protein